MMSGTISITHYFLYGLLLLVPSSLVYSESTSHSVEELDSSTSYDCTVVRLDEVDDASLTTAERIALMDQSLLDSIDQYDECVHREVSNNAAGGSAGGGGGGGAGTEGAAGGSSAGAEEGQSEEAQEEASAEGENSTEEERGNRQTLASGRGAQDKSITPKDNDAAVCQLLREELEVEKDPQKQAELKEIYKSYRCRR